MALLRIQSARPSKSLIIVGLRGVGKTVLLNEISELSEKYDYHTMYLEAHEGKSLAEMLIPLIRRALIKISAKEKARELANKGLRTLKGFASAFKVIISGLELGINPEFGTADSGHLENDLPELFEALGKAAKSAQWPIAIYIDELQYLSEKEFSALIISIHRVNQLRLPVILIGAVSSHNFMYHFDVRFLGLADAYSGIDVA